jgi:predicted DNA-binding transcriptional regulator AlpA
VGNGEVRTLASPRPSGTFRLLRAGDVALPQFDVRFALFSKRRPSTVRKVRLFETVHAADELGLSPRTLEGWRRRGEGPPYLKIGRRVKYRPEDIEAYKASRLCANLPPQQSA